MATRSTREAVVTNTASNDSGSEPQERDDDVDSAAGAGFQSAVGGGSHSRCSEQGSRSALGQSRQTRIQEKNELVNLNDRLAAYMDRVRELEIQNTRLVHRIETKEETRIQEVTSVKTRYETELSNARRAVDLAASENARLQLEANKWQADTEVLQTKLAKREHKWSTGERHSKDLESHVIDLQSRLNQAHARLKDVGRERENLTNELVQAKADLQDKTLCVADLTNKMKTLNQQRNFEKSLHEKELEEMAVVMENQIRETDLQREDNHDRKGAELLQDLREQYESEMQLSRKQVQKIYETKINDLQVLLDRRSSDDAVALSELKCCETRLQDVNARVAELESLNNSVSSRTRDLEQLLEEGRNRFRQALGVKENNIQRSQDEIEEQKAEFQDLLDTKVALDLEIAAYRTLLEGEETRMNISPSSSTLGSTEMFVTSHRGTKRKRTFMPYHEESNADMQATASAKGDIQVSDICNNGRYIIVHNKGTKEVPLSGWKVQSTSGNDGYTFTFKGAYTIKPGACVTIWSSDCGVPPHPPEDLVIRNAKWPKGDQVRAALIDPEGEEVAHRESSVHQLRRLMEHTSGTVGASSSEPILHDCVAKDDSIH